MPTNEVTFRVKDLAEVFDVLSVWNISPPYRLEQEYLMQNLSEDTLGLVINEVGKDYFISWFDFLEKPPSNIEVFSETALKRYLAIRKLS